MVSVMVFVLNRLVPFSIEAHKPHPRRLTIIFMCCMHVKYSNECAIIDWTETGSESKQVLLIII